jgi:hypothetical protein
MCLNALAPKYLTWLWKASATETDEQDTCRGKPPFAPPSMRLAMCQQRIRIDENHYPQGRSGVRSPRSDQTLKTNPASPHRPPSTIARRQAQPLPPATTQRGTEPSTQIRYPPVWSRAIIQLRASCCRLMRRRGRRLRRTRVGPQDHARSRTKTLHTCSRQGRD